MILAYYMVLYDSYTTTHIEYICIETYDLEEKNSTKCIYNLKRNLNS